MTSLIRRIAIRPKRPRNSSFGSPTNSSPDWNRKEPSAQLELDLQATTSTESSGSSETITTIPSGSQSFTEPTTMVDALGNTVWFAKNGACMTNRGPMDVCCGLHALDTVNCVLYEVDSIPVPDSSSFIIRWSCQKTTPSSNQTGLRSVRILRERLGWSLETLESCVRWTLAQLNGPSHNAGLTLNRRTSLTSLPRLDVDEWRRQNTWPLCDSGQSN